MPFTCHKQDIEQFFKGLTWTKNNIFWPTKKSGDSAGYCFIQFSTVKDGEAAQELHNVTMKGRKISVQSRVVNRV